MYMQEKLFEAALKARLHAYAPYSDFKVGAAVLTANGDIYTGCNVENAAYSVTCCAERVAIYKAISSGIHKFSAILITADTHKPISPCGSCRQVITELFPKDAPIYLTNINGEKKVILTKELLPDAFSPDDLVN